MTSSGLARRAMTSRAIQQHDKDSRKQNCVLRGKLIVYGESDALAKNDKLKDTTKQRNSFIIAPCNRDMSQAKEDVAVMYIRFLINQFYRKHELKSATAAKTNSCLKVALHCFIIGIAIEVESVTKIKLRVLTKNFLIKKRIFFVVTHVYLPVTGQRETLTVGRSKNFLLQ